MESILRRQAIRPRAIQFCAGRGQVWPQFFQEAIGARGQIRGGSAKHAKSGNFVDGVAEVGAESCFERADRELVHAKRAKQRMAADLLHQFFLSGDDARLGTAKEFIATEDNERYASIDAAADSGFVDAEGRQIEQTTGAEIFDKRKICFLAERNKIGEGRLFREAGHLKI